MLTPEQAQRLACELFAAVPDADDKARVTGNDDGARREAESHRLAHGRLPQRIGNCRIIRLIASGGMGAVYEAVQDHPRRTVAVKVAPTAHPAAGAAWSRSARHRFQIESEILGRLQHPNIAQIYAAGVHDDGEGGIPYFVMEYVPEALPITEYAKTHNLDLPARLELFLQACDAVQHGHTRGFIHRDLKPANMLVGTEIGSAVSPSLEGGDQGVGGASTAQQPSNPPQASGLKPQDSPAAVKNIDFGVSRATNADISLATLHTATGQIVGTLQYMSPEQCEGRADDVDTRSDVYALGVVLYELLCDRLPYSLEGASITEAARIVGHIEPEHPRTIDRSLPRDLETIALKALHKDRARRYQSVGEFGDALRRWLRHEPILARQPGKWMKAARWVGRHPVMTTAAMCLAIAPLTAVSTFLSVWYLNKRPHRVDYVYGGQDATLKARSGATIKTWHDPLSAIRGAMMFDAEIEGRNRRLLAMAFNDYSAEPRLSHSLVMYDVDESADEPVWQAAIKEDDIPVHLRDEGFLATHFHPDWIILEEVFQDNPGPEIISSFQSTGSQCVLRIYSVDPKRTDPLCEFWHDGNLNACAWMSKHRLLVLAGVNGECFWKERGYPDCPVSHHPNIILGLSPQLGMPMRQSVTANMVPPKPVQWYQALLPPEEADLVGVLSFSVPFAPYDNGDHLRITLVDRVNHDRSFNMIIDHHGMEVPTDHSPSNGWRVHPLTDVMKYHLGPLPPKVVN